MKNGNGPVTHIQRNESSLDRCESDKVFWLGIFRKCNGILQGRAYWIDGSKTSICLIIDWRTIDWIFFICERNDLENVRIG